MSTDKGSERREGEASGRRKYGDGTENSAEREKGGGGGGGTRVNRGARRNSARSLPPVRINIS